MHAPRGPYLLQAVLCEKVLTEQDGVASVIRAIDRINHNATGPEAPVDMPEVRFPLILFINIKPGSALGRHQLVVRMVAPDGQATALGQFPVNFDGGEDRGAIVGLNLDSTYRLEGLYWFEIYWDEQNDEHLLTRVPLRVLYNRLVAGAHHN